MTQDPGFMDTDAHQAGQVGEARHQAALADQVDDGDGPVVDEVDAPEEQLVDEAELDAVEAALAAVGDALDRLADGTYGACEICGRPVADHVLAADPTAGRCPEHLPLQPASGPPGGGPGPLGTPGG